MNNDLQARNKRTILMVIGIVAAMLLLTYKSVDLYRLFCQITGFGGQAQEASIPSGPVIDREITVRFNSDVNPNLPWEFKPDVSSVKVKLGQEMLISFTAKNVSNRPVAGTAIYNIAPDKAGRFFSKTQCFCFNYQLIAPGETAHFPVVFYIDPALDKERALDDIKTITLSYTFFQADSPELEEALEDFYNDPKSATKAVPIK